MNAQPGISLARPHAYIIHVMQNANEILWTSAFLNERFTEPVSPLGWSFVGALFEELALRDPLRYMGYPDANNIPATRLWHAQPFVNVELFRIFYKPFPDALVPEDAVRYFPNGDVSDRKRAPYPTSRYQLRFLSSLFRHLLRDALNASPLNYRKWQGLIPCHDAQTGRLSDQLDAAPGERALLQITAQLYDLDAQLLSIHRWSLTYADLFYKILAHWTGDLAPLLISGVPNKTREVNTQLEALAHMPAPLNAELLTRIRAGAPLRDGERETARALHEFLKAHGHRAFSLDLAHPTFRDDPTQLIPLLSAGSLAQSPDIGNLHRAYLQARRSLRPWQRPLFRPLVGLARRYAQLREDQRYYWQKSLALTRRAYLHLGALWAAQSALAAPEDIFYATRSEIQACGQGDMDASFLRARITARQSEWRAYRNDFAARGAAAAPLMIRGDTPVSASQTVAAETNIWQGRGLSPGVARGVARLVNDPRDLGRVRAGEILVAPSTDPAWTPVFARLGGLILERGGMLSHGAVVAREYQLPAVVAPVGLYLHDGDWVELDGMSGVVKRNPGG